ncbi:MAG: PH domain-containing protein [Rhizobiaceae bacterium]
MRGDNDNPDGVRQVFGPSLPALLLPSAVIGAGYLLLFVWMAMGERAEGPIGRLCLVVLSVGVPFLIAHAVLRAVTIRLSVLPHALVLQPGFPRAGAVEASYAEIVGVAVKRAPFGRLISGGTLSVALADGTTLAIADLADPDAASAAISERIAPECLQAVAETPAAVTSAHF